MSENNKKTRKEQYIEKRKALIALSAGLRQMVKEGVYATVNEGLRDLYINKDSTIESFNTFMQWKELGYTIKKGSKAFLFWGQPRKVEQVQEDSGEPDEYKYYPICYLFANTQVIKPEMVQEVKQEQEKAVVSDDVLS